MFIYLIRNRVNQKVYVGKTTMKTVEHRWKDHRNKLRRNAHVNRHLQRSFNLYGPSSFIYSVIFECNNTSLLNDMEQVFIYSYKSHKNVNGYNMSFGGEGNKMTLEGRARMSEIAKKRTGSRNPFFGKTHSTESRALISKASTGRLFDKSARIKMSKTHRGKKVSDETKLKMSVASLGRAKSEEAKLNMKKAWERRRAMKCQN